MSLTIIPKDALKEMTKIEHYLFKLRDELKFKTDKKLIQAAIYNLRSAEKKIKSFQVKMMKNKERFK